jgi:exodeoxyribonuclease VII large subunit
MSEPLVFTVSDFVAFLNQTLEVAYPYVVVEGELSNFRIARGRWVYFDLKDETASVHFFGGTYSLPGPLEEGMMLRVSGNPRLHPQYGFSVNVQTVTPVGEGNLRRAADLLAKKLQAEGLFAEERKRPLPYPPRRIALLTAANSAAYADFLKILNVRWRGVVVDHFDVQVQGEPAAAQIVSAITTANALSDLPEVLVLTRGGGSADDLAVFSDERVVRAIAASRVPTLVAIGHEIDVSLAELAADRRASTPSNAAELLTPDSSVVLSRLREVRQGLHVSLRDRVRQPREWTLRQRTEIDHAIMTVFREARAKLRTQSSLLEAYDPTVALRRGYALVRMNGNTVRSVKVLRVGETVDVQLSDGAAKATITEKRMNDGTEN